MAPNFCLGSDGVANVHPRVRRPGRHHQHQGILFCREKKFTPKLSNVVFLFNTNGIGFYNNFLLLLLMPEASFQLAHSWMNHSEHYINQKY